MSMKMIMSGSRQEHGHLSVSMSMSVTVSMSISMSEFCYSYFNTSFIRLYCCLCRQCFNFQCIFICSKDGRQQTTFSTCTPKKGRKRIDFSVYFYPFNGPNQKVTFGSNLPTSGCLHFPILPTHIRIFSTQRSSRLN